MNPSYSGRRRYRDRRQHSLRWWAREDARTRATPSPASSVLSFTLSLPPLFSYRHTPHTHSPTHLSERTGCSVHSSARTRRRRRQRVVSFGGSRPLFTRQDRRHGHCRQERSSHRRRVLRPAGGGGDVLLLAAPRPRTRHHREQGEDDEARRTTARTLISARNLPGDARIQSTPALRELLTLLASPPLPPHLQPPRSIVSGALRPLALSRPAEGAKLCNGGCKATAAR